uniref:Retinoic acid receptor responder protein 2 n=1 Tax=Electrophorus electricus TaxID=8005 RepID=A0A4W4EBN8_ELEEL
MFFTHRSSVCEKMAEWLHVVVFIAAVFLSSSEGLNDFDKLSDSYKKGVELAIEQVNSHAGVQQHFLFFKSLKQSSIEAGFEVSYFYHHFYLKATKCSRGTENANSKKCAFRNDRPLIDCAMCYKTYREKIEEEPKPFVHCVHRPALTEEMKNTRVEHCNKMGYGSGSPTLLASTGSD